MSLRVSQHLNRFLREQAEAAHDPLSRVRARAGIILPPLLFFLRRGRRPGNAFRNFCRLKSE